jgi:hypothetical protein
MYCPNNIFQIVFQGIFESVMVQCLVTISARVQTVKAFTTTGKMVFVQCTCTSVTARLLFPQLVRSPLVQRMYTVCQFMVTGHSSYYNFVINDLLVSCAPSNPGLKVVNDLGKWQANGAKLDL